MAYHLEHFHIRFVSDSESRYSGTVAAYTVRNLSFQSWVYVLIGIKKEQAMYNPRERAQQPETLLRFIARHHVIGII